MKNNKGFTLIELLVVVTIIALLAGLAVPAIGAALESAKKAEATAVCTQIKTALSTYLNEYGAWPSEWTEDEMETGPGTMLNILLGEDNTNNPRQIVFMEFSDDSLVDRTDATLGVNDPWRQTYKIKIDHDYNNKVDSPDNITIRTNAIVWSLGKDGNFQSSKDPKSW